MARNDQDKKIKLEKHSQQEKQRLMSITTENGVNLYEEAVKFWASPDGLKAQREAFNGHITDT